MIWLARALAMLLLALAAFAGGDEGHVMAAGLAFVGLCCLRDS